MLHFICNLSLIKNIMFQNVTSKGIKMFCHFDPKPKVKIRVVLKHTLVLGKALLWKLQFQNKFIEEI